MSAAAEASRLGVQQAVLLLLVELQARRYLIAVERADPQL